MILNFSNDRKKIAVLIDPSGVSQDKIIQTIVLADSCAIDYIFVGGSLISNGNFEDCIIEIKKHTNIPVIIFPGNNMQLSKYADAILFLSLISGRNPELLIGNHVISAPIIKSFNLKSIPVGYILIDGGKVSTVQYISNTTPIPSDKPDIAVCTAIAGEMLGLKIIYLEAGSGAERHIPYETIKKVKQSISLPLIVGGGIKTAEQANNIFKFGADIIVVGNIIEKDPNLIKEFAEIRNQINVI